MMSRIEGTSHTVMPIYVYLVLLVLKSDIVLTSGLTSEVTCHDALDCKGFPASCRNQSRVARSTPSADLQARMMAHVKQRCFCDDHCLLEDDCCADYRSIIDDSEYLAVDKSVVTCVRAGDISMELNLFAVSVVNKCPTTWENTQIKDLCEKKSEFEDVFMRWPVSVAHNHLTYKNIYCALCNGVAEDVKYWIANVTCKTEYDKDTQNSSLTDIIADNHQNLLSRACNVTFSAHQDKFRYCKIHIDSCPQSWNDSCTRDLCEGANSAVGFVYDKKTKTTYKNEYCAKCNGVPKSSMFCNDYRIAELFPAVGAPVFYPLILLLDLNSHSGTVINHKVGHNTASVEQKEILHVCQELQVFDPFRGTCRDVTCGPGFEYVSGMCVRGSGSKDVNGTVELGCLMESYNEGEYHVMNDGSVYINLTKTMVGSDSYNMANGVLYICTNLTQNGTAAMSGVEVNMKFSQAQTIISIIGQVISIIALTAHFVIYCLLPKLQNLPGKNLMCLVAALFMAQLMFLTGVGRTSDYGGCVTIAIIIHYCFLASFSWMNVMSFDIFGTFWYQVHNPSPASQTRRFIRYSVYAWTAPVGIVLIAIIVNFTANVNDPYRPAYGEVVCWISHRPALGVFFAAPVAIILAANIVFFSLTVYSIYKVSKIARVARREQKSSKRLFFLYLKLSTIMGLTWSFGFIASAGDVHFFWYLFLIFNSLQGLFIFVAFVCTRKVYQLLQERVGRITRSKKEESSMEERTRSTQLMTSQSDTN